MTWDAEMENLADAVRDTFGVSVLVKRVPLTSLNTATMKRAKLVGDEQTVAADRSRTRVTHNDAGAPVHEVVYDVRASDLSFTPEQGDSITDGGRVTKITRVEWMLERKMVRLITHRSLGAA